MKKFLISRYMMLALVVLSATLSLNAGVPPRPKNANELVYDYAHVIDSANLAVINDSLKSLYRYNKSQVVVLTVESLDGMDIADYCQEVFETWGIGDKETNNGVLIVVKPKTESSNGKVRIHTGYGAEGVLPDLLCKKIQTDSMIPAFKENNYGLAILKAVSLITPAMKGEYPQDIKNFLDEKEKERKSISQFIADSAFTRCGNRLCHPLHHSVWTHLVLLLHAHQEGLVFVDGVAHYCCRGGLFFEKK